MLGNGRTPTIRWWISSVNRVHDDYSGTGYYASFLFYGVLSFRLDRRQPGANAQGNRSIGSKSSRAVAAHAAAAGTRRRRPAAELRSAPRISVTSSPAPSGRPAPKSTLIAARICRSGAYPCRPARIYAFGAGGKWPSIADSMLPRPRTIAGVDLDERKASPAGREIFGLSRCAAGDARRRAMPSTLMIIATT